MHPKVYEAAKLGDIDSLKAIISGNGEDLFHQTTPKKNNILHIAAQHKQVHLIEHLLQCPLGLSLLWQDNYKGDTPLHVAAKAGSCEAIRVFINLTKSLDWVVEDGQVDACKELLQKPNLHKDTTLHYAIRGGHDEMVKLLIEEDPQLCNITNSSDESPLYLAAHRRLSNTIKLILDVFPLSSSHKGPKGLTVLHAAVHYSLPNWWEIPEKRPEMIREGDDMGWTPLHYATCFGNVKAVRLLLQHNISVAYDLDKEGELALHVAAFQGHIPVIDELVTFCPDACDMINAKGQTALHAAVIGGQIKLVKHILRVPNLEDLINEEDTNGNTALHLAMLHRRYIIMYILARDKRVDRFVTNKDHLTALDIIFASERYVNFATAQVYRRLEGSHGFPVIQDWVKKYVKKILHKQFVEGQPAEAMTTGSDIANQENFHPSIRSIVDSQLLVAAFIATVTFAAAFTMPGGYSNDGPNQGMATLAGRVAFKAFVIFNTIAFSFSTLALFLQYNTSFLNDHRREYAGAVISNIYIATLGMVLAFASGTYVVLTKTTGLGVVPYVVIGSFVAEYFIEGILQPEMYFGALRFLPYGLLKGSRRYYGIR
ncbi:hypothetical protein BT93_D1307 [Corymbia citriodora subsp. variegata]|nr:hypothetical protein BT93_D1307 [Corymbia citriodora subsp. variegata]